MLVLPWPKKRTIVAMHHVISKNLRSNFAAMHRCEKSRQSQVAFARGSTAESSTGISRYHKILILCISSMVLLLSKVVRECLYVDGNEERKASIDKTIAMSCDPCQPNVNTEYHTFTYVLFIIATPMLLCESVYRKHSV